MRTGTLVSSPVTVDPGALAWKGASAEQLRSAFTRCRRDVSMPQKDSQLRNLIKRVEHGRVRLAEHMLAIAYDAFSRGGRQEDVEAPGHAFVAIIRGWYRRTRKSIEVEQLIKVEAGDRATLQVRQVDYLIQHTPKAAADLEEAIARDVGDLEAALEQLRTERYAGSGAAA